jgi:hypothetical protein
MSEFGLGLCAEELGDWDKAKSIYEEIVANPDYQGTIFVPQAQERLEATAEYSEPVYFTEAEPAETTRQEQIGIQPNTVMEPIEPSVAPSTQLVSDANEIVW